MNTSSSGKDAAASIYGAVDGWKYRLSAAVEDNENLKTPVGDMPNTYFSSRTASGFLSYDISPKATVGMNVDYYDLEFGSTSITQDGFSVDVPEWKRMKSAVFTEVRDVNDYLSRLRADAFYQKGKKQMTNTISSTGTIVQPIADNDMDQYGFSIQSDWKLGESNFLIAGYELNYDKLDANSITKMTSGQMAMTMGNHDYDGYQMQNAVFASMETYLPYDLTLNYGVRYTWVKTDMTHVNLLKSTSESLDGSDGKAVFNAGILWHGNDNLTLRATYAQGFRSPILQELYIDTAMGHGSSTTYANPDLKPETSDNFEIGARWLSKALTVDATVYYTETDDYITTIYKTAKKGYQYDNVAKAKSFGAEFSVAYRVGMTGFEPYTTLTWMRRQYDDGAGFTTYDTATPELMARYGVRWTGEYDGLALRTDVYARSLTETKYSAADSKDNYTLSGYTTLNLTAGVSFGDEKQYSLDAGFYNIFDKAYREQMAVYEPGRYLAVKLNAKF